MLQGVLPGFGRMPVTMENAKLVGDGVDGITLLRWMLEHPQFGPEQLLCFVQAGIVDLQGLASLPDVDSAYFEVEQLLRQAPTDQSGALVEPLPLADLPILIQLGHRAYLNVGGQIQQWQKLAERLAGEDDWVIAELIMSGRTPDQATELIDTAQELRIDVATYGFHPSIDPDLMRRLLGAGIHTEQDYLALLDAGLGVEEAESIHRVAAEHGLSTTSLGLDEMTAERFGRLATAGFRSAGEYQQFLEITSSEATSISLRQAGVDVAVLTEAHRTQLPARRYLQLATVPAAWFPTTGTDRRTPLQTQPPYTWDDLIYLAGHGWQQCGREGLLAVDPASARWLAEHQHTADSYLTWRAALDDKPRARERRQRPVHAPDPRRPDPDVVSVIDRAAALQGLGLTAADTAEYRLCGLTGSADIQKALQAGVDGIRAAKIRAAHGRRLPRQGNSRRLTGLAELLALYHGGAPQKSLPS
jgi:hypothetical protein